MVAVRQEILRLLAQSSENEIRIAMGGALPAVQSRLLLEALDSALAPPPALGGVHLRLFAVPVLLVAGGNAGAVLPCVVPDIAEVTRLLETTGAFGRVKTVGFSNVLTAAESVEALFWRMLNRIALGDDLADVTGFDLPPASLTLQSDDEQVDLRFLAGAAVEPADAPSFVESAADIGRWGMPFTQALSRQLSGRGITVLPIPRPAMSLLLAVHAGRFARAELGLQLFLSNALRRARMRFGEPEATVSAHTEDASIRVRLTSVFDESFIEEYRWPLTPADDLAAVTQSIFGLLAEVRLDRVTVLDTVIGMEQKS
jgi:hypothetical protein